MGGWRGRAQGCSSDSVRARAGPPPSRASPGGFDHHPGDLLQQLRGHGRGHARDVAARVVLDDVGADDRLADGMKEVDHLAGRWAAWLAMRYPRCKGRIQSIHVERDID